MIIKQFLIYKLEKENIVMRKMTRFLKQNFKEGYCIFNNLVDEILMKHNPGIVVQNQNQSPKVKGN